MELADSAPIQLNELPGPRGLPFLGNLHRIRIERFHLILEDWAERFGPLFRIRMGSHSVAVLSDRSAIQHILLRRPDAFRRSSVLADVAAEMRLNGVFTAEGDDWHRQRRMVVAALNRARLGRFFPKLTSTVSRLQRRWECAADSGEAVDVCGDLMRFTVDVTMQVAFGVDPNTLETSGPVIQHHLDKVFPKLHQRETALVPYWRYFRLPSDRVLDQALDALQEEVLNMVSAARARLAAEPWRHDEPEDFLEAILAELESEGSEFSNAEIFANAGTLLLAGEDTTANSIAWITHFFTRYPEYFERCRMEVDALVAPEPCIRSFELTHRLPFLDAFANEVMRLKPVAPIHGIETLEDVEILDCLIPKGTLILALARRMATRDENFAGGDRFDPDRWLTGPEARNGPHDRRAFIPFGGGPRICPGRNLALLQIRTVVAMLCRNFDLEPDHSSPDVAERLAFTMMPVNLSLRLKRRDLQ